MLHILIKQAQRFACPYWAGFFFPLKYKIFSISPEIGVKLMFHFERLGFIFLNGG